MSASMRTRFSTFNAPDDGWRFLTNLEKTKKEIVLQAIAESGQEIEWRDTPHEPSRGAEVVGSVWSREPGRNASPFWRAYERIEAKVKSTESASAQSKGE